MQLDRPPDLERTRDVVRNKTHATHRASSRPQFIIATLATLATLALAPPLLHALHTTTLLVDAGLPEDLPRLDMLERMRQRSRYMLKTRRDAVAAQLHRMRSYALQKSELTRAAADSLCDASRPVSYRIRTLPPSVRSKVEPLLQLNEKDLISMYNVSEWVQPSWSLHDALLRIAADMACVGCARERAVDGAIAAAPLLAKESFAAFASWYYASMSTFSASAASTLLPSHTATRGVAAAPEAFTLHRAHHNISLTLLATGGAEASLVDDAGNEYALIHGGSSAGADEDETFFYDVVKLIVSATVGGAVAVRLRQLPIVGYLVAGVAIGPKGLSLITEIAQTEVLANLGIALLLFGLGGSIKLELIREVRAVAVIGGVLQLALICLIAGGAFAVVGAGFHVGATIGLCVSMASTAVVLRSLEAARVTQSPAGKLALAILVLQDVLTGLVLGFLPLVASPDGATLALLHVGAASLVVATFLCAERLLLPALSALLEASPEDELRVLTYVSLCLVGAGLTQRVGFSAELGAFFAGLNLSAHPTSASEALRKTEHIRDVLVAVFFVCVGMVVDPAYLVSHFGSVLLSAAAIAALKAAVCYATLRCFFVSGDVSAECALMLAHAGEFAFVIAAAARSAGLLADGDHMVLLGAVALSLLTSPPLIRWAVQGRSPIVQMGARSESATSLAVGEKEPLTAS